MFVKRFVLVVGPGRQLRFLDMYQRGYVIDTVLSYPEALRKLSEANVVDLVLLEAGSHRQGAREFCLAVRAMRPNAKIVLLANKVAEVEDMSADVIVDPAIHEDELAMKFRSVLDS